MFLSPSADSVPCGRCALWPTSGTLTSSSRLNQYIDSSVVGLPSSHCPPANSPDPSACWIRLVALTSAAMSGSVRRCRGK